ncbi:hypothetical protein AB0K20_24400 [Micromonospora matsumotoense]|uniref:hypothetical protein n=1 Tax=Micromonospora matsumotoense TaxID=121616 RepID=UPI0034368D2F
MAVYPSTRLAAYWKGFLNGPSSLARRFLIDSYGGLTAHCPIWIVVGGKSNGEATLRSFRQSYGVAYLPSMRRRSAT